MSDLNDLIATNSINAFNQGVQTGVRQEQERIIKLLDDPSVFGIWADHGIGLVFRENLIALIKGENK